MFHAGRNFAHFYRLQRICGKVMFLHLCVGGGSLSRRWASVQGVSVQAGHCPGEEGLCPGWGSLSGELFFCPGDGPLSRGSLSRQVTVLGRRVSVQDGGLCLESSFSIGVSVQRVSVQGDPPKYGYVRAVRILLECILVHNCLFADT